MIFLVGFIIAAYSYSLFFLGISSNISSASVLVATLIFFSMFLAAMIKWVKINFLKVSNFSKLEIFSLVLIILLCIINLIGALAPELSFDALWYHLTLPKIYIESGEISYIPGGLFYYSVMPKLIDILYIPSLLFGNEVGAKLTHYFFGVLTSIVLFLCVKEFVNRKIALLCVLLFLSNLVVSWEMTVAYIDLGRTFYESLSLFAFILWLKSKSMKYIYILGLTLGCAVASKYLAIVSVGLYVVLIGLVSFQSKYSFPLIVKNIIYTLFYSFIVPLPWFLFAYVYTGNPLYPSFTTDINALSFSLTQLLPFNIVISFWNLFMKSPDPISPIYFIVLPLIFAFYKKFTNMEKIIILLGTLSVVSLIFLPQIGGGRFTLAYLPLYSLVVGIIISKSGIKVRKTITLLIFLTAFITIAYRGVAHIRYIPVVFGFEKKESFLMIKLNFAFGDFYDPNIKNLIIPNSKVLVVGSHNLYYVDFPFDHESYSRDDDEYKYIVTHNSSLPQKYKDYIEIYSNNENFVKLYKYEE